VAGRGARPFPADDEEDPVAGEKIGFVGLGIMGKPMAKNLIKAGHELVIYSGSSSADELKDEGAETADSYKAIAEQCEKIGRAHV
jgi:3-hydroxyisobutyrate dehydrogenase-like beta-hydroxyacid dehydrogenase